MAQHLMVPGVRSSPAMFTPQGAEGQMVEIPSQGRAPSREGVELASPASKSHVQRAQSRNSREDLGYPYLWTSQQRHIHGPYESADMRFSPSPPQTAASRHTHTGSCQLVEGPSQSRVDPDRPWLHSIKKLQLEKKSPPPSPPGGSRAASVPLIQRPATTGPHWTVPKVQTPKPIPGMGWAAPKGPDVWSKFSKECRRWEGQGPTLPNRVNSVHTHARSPTRKYVSAALNSRHRAVQTQPHPVLPGPPHSLPTPATIERDKRIKLESREKYRNRVVRQKWNPDSLEALIMVKINERLKSNNGAIFQAFRLFNEDGGTGDNSIDKDEFRTVLSKLLQTTITWKECEDLFSRYDRDGSGDIDIYEFIDGIMRPFGQAQTLVGSLEDVKDCADFANKSSTEVNHFRLNTERPPPVVERPASGINYMLEVASPPRQDPNFVPDQMNRHPHAAMLEEEVGLSPGLSPYAVSGCISDAERDMAKQRLELMNFAFMYNTTQCMRPLRRNKDPSKPWRPFKPM